MQTITYFLSHPIQYFSPLLKALAKRTNLKVYYFSDESINGKKDIGFNQPITWDVPLFDGYNHAFVKNYSSHSAMDNRVFDAFNPGVMKILFKDKSAVVIVNGWTYSSTIMCIVTARLLGKKVWLRAESPLNQELRKRKLILLIKKILLKHFLFRFFINRCLYIGTENKKFFNYHGVSEEQMVYTPYAVDNTYFSAQYKLLKNDLPAVKAMLGIPEKKKIILFSGKYVSKKRPLDLVKAFHLAARDNYALVMVGEGMLRTEIETYIQVHQLKYVYLTGFINQSDISKYYAIADVFVMCSGMGETWGLSVNEAMNFEKPIIVSATCGCSSDLVVHGINGFIFNEGDTQQLADYLAQILEDNGLRESMGKMSGKIVGDFSIGVSVDNLCSELYGTD